MKPKFDNYWLTAVILLYQRSFKCRRTHFFIFLCAPQHLIQCITHVMCLTNMFLALQMDTSGLDSHQNQKSLKTATYSPWLQTSFPNSGLNLNPDSNEKTEVFVYLSNSKHMSKVIEYSNRIYTYIYSLYILFIN